MERRQQDERTGRRTRFSVWGTSRPNMFNGVIYVGAPPCPYTPLWLPCLPRLGCNLSTRGGRKKIICHLNLKIIYFYEANTSRAQEQWPQGADREGREGRVEERDGDRAREGVCKKWQLFNTRSTFVGILCVKFFHYVLSAPERESKKGSERRKERGREKERERRGRRGRRGRQTGRVGAQFEMGKCEMENGANSLACHLNEAVRWLAALCFASWYFI